MGSTALTHLGRRLRTHTGAALARAAFYPAAALPTLAFAAHFVADALPGSHGQLLNSWPNAGTGGSQYDLLAHGSALPTLLRGSGPNGHDCVRIPGPAWFESAARGPLAGNGPACLWLVAKLSSLSNQDLLTLGVPQGGRGCGIYEYENSGGGSWWIYYYGNTVRAVVVGQWVLLLWRGRVEGGTYAVYTNANDAPDPQSPPASFVDIEPNAPLRFGNGFIWGLADQLDVAEFGVEDSFPEGMRWQLMRNRFVDRYGLSL